MNGKQIKTIALIKLKGNWGNCLAITFAMCAMFLMLGIGTYVFNKSINYGIRINAFPSDILTRPLTIAVEIIIGITMFLLLSMIHYIIVKQFADISAGMNFVTSRNAVYTGIRNFARISILPNLLKYLIIFACTVPGIFAVHSANRLISSSESLTFFSLLIFMLSILMIIFSVILTVSCVLTLHILPLMMTFNPSLSPYRAIFMCFKLTEGQRLRMLVFYLSFLKYLPFCLLVYPIFILIPYFTMSDLVLQYDIMGDYFSDDKFFTFFEEQKSEE